MYFAPKYVIDYILMLLRKILSISISVLGFFLCPSWDSSRWLWNQILQCKCQVTSQYIPLQSLVLSCNLWLWGTYEVQDRKYFYAKVPKSQTCHVQLLKINLWEGYMVHYSLRKKNSLIWELRIPKTQKIVLEIEEIFCFTL